MALSTIHYTGEQARSFASVSPEAWRHWRKAVPHLAAKAGKKARFAPGELIALAAMASAVSAFGVGIAGLANQWNNLFRECSNLRIDALRTAVVVITEQDVGVVDADTLVFDQPAIVVPCAPIVDRLWSTVLTGVVEQTQVPLPFSPQALIGSKR